MNRVISISGGRAKKIEIVDPAGPNSPAASRAKRMSKQRSQQIAHAFYVCNREPNWIRREWGSWLKLSDINNCLREAHDELRAENGKLKRMLDDANDRAMRLGSSIDYARRLAA